MGNTNLDFERTLQECKERIRSLEAALQKQRRLNETLLETQNIERTILDRSLAGYYISLNGKFAVMNPVAASYTGYRPDRIIGKKSDSLIHPDDKARTKANARAMLRGEQTAPTSSGLCGGTKRSAGSWKWWPPLF